jgi:hypothetical protein
MNLELMFDKFGRIFDPDQIIFCEYEPGDDFYMISKENPLKIKGPPIFAGYGNFKVRVATRSEFYEVQAEIKVQNMLRSKFSVAPGTKKENPFMNIKK